MRRRTETLAGAALFRSLSPDALRALISGMNEIGCAGIAIKTKRFLPEVPRSVAELADEPALSEELTGISQRIAEQKGHVPHVVLNFEAVSYLNSSNLAQLLRLRKQLNEHKRLLKLCSVKDDLWSVFLITGLDKVFRFAPDPMTALAGIQIEAGQQ